MNEQNEECDQGESAAAGGTRKSDLVTRRLVLRTPMPEDAQAITEIANNMSIASQTSRIPHPYSLKDAEDWIASIGDEAAVGEIAYLITAKADGTALGAAGFTISECAGTEIGYWIGEPFWGKGFATEAAQAVIDQAFTTPETERIFACCHASNNASRKVLEKCGFKHTGPGMCACGALNTMVPSEDFQLERGVWKSLKNWSAA